jgi:hypothetical protein
MTIDSWMQSRKPASFDGRFLELIPPTSVVSYWVCFVQGVTLRVILRKIGNGRFQVIGEAI